MHTIDPHLPDCTCTGNDQIDTDTRWHAMPGIMLDHPEVIEVERPRRPVVERAPVLHAQDLRHARAAYSVRSTTTPPVDAARSAAHLYVMPAVGDRATAHHPSCPGHDYEVELVGIGRSSVKARRTGVPVESIAGMVRTYTRRPGGRFVERGSTDWPVLVFEPA